MDEHLEILTPSGFKRFKAISGSHHETGRELTFSDGTTVRCSNRHRFISPGGPEIFSMHAHPGHVIGDKRVLFNTEILKGAFYYDPMGVDGAIYLHDNGLVSHNSFLGTGSTLISPDCLMGLKAGSRLRVENDVNIYHDCVPDHNYVMTVDVSKGRGQDYSTFTIIDVSVNPMVQAAVFRSNTISPLLLPDLCHVYALKYNGCFVVIESNDVGVVVCNGLYYDLEYENVYTESAVKANSVGLEMNKRTKRIGCSHFKDMVETNKLLITDAETINEMTTFEANGTSFEATEGNHDDLVMNLVLFGWFSQTPEFHALVKGNEHLKDMMFADRLKAQVEELAPVGIFSAQEEKRSQFERDHDGIRWEIVESGLFGR